MKRNTVVLQGDNFVINDVDYGTLVKCAVDDQVVYLDSWWLERHLSGVFGESISATLAELGYMATSWYISVPVGNRDVGIYFPVGTDVARLCKDISAKHGEANVTAYARILMRCRNGEELKRLTLEDFYTDVSKEDLEATRFF